MQNQQRVLIIGGGFGGCVIAKSLAACNLSITLIDRCNHHLFQPLLYQVATAMLSPAQIAYPIRGLFRGKKNITVLIGNVIDIDRDKKEVIVKNSNQTFPYDYLIIATGARHSYFGKPEWEEHAWGLKTMKDAIKIRERLLYSLEKAERTRFQEKQNRYSTFVIVGAGPTGVEMAGAIAEMTHKTLVKDFNRFDTRTSKIILIEGSDRVLNRYPSHLSIKAKHNLEQLGVEVVLNTFVEVINACGVGFKGRFIETENIIWAAGNAASPLIKTCTSHTNNMGQAMVNPDFSIQEDPNIFCIGDCAYLEDRKGRIVPAVAQGALQAGRFVAQQIKQDLKKKPRGSFQYNDKGTMATIGRSKAVAQLPHFTFSGFVAWLLWGFIHILFIVSFKNRLIIFMSWFVSYITHQRSVRLINMHREKPPE